VALPPGGNTRENKLAQNLAILLPKGLRTAALWNEAEQVPLGYTHPLGVKAFVGADAHIGPPTHRKNSRKPGGAMWASRPTTHNR